MTEESLAWAAALLILFVGLILYFTIRIRAGRRPVLRRIRVYDNLRGLMGRAVESGRKLHLSLGIGSMANETTADSLAGLAVLNYVGDQAAETGVFPLVSMADPTVMLLAQNTLRPAGAEEAYRHVRWIAPQPAAYAAGVMNILDSDETDSTVQVGRFGDEYLLMGETAARNDLVHIGGTSDPNALAFIYGSTPRGTLLGEEIYAAGAYLQRFPSHIGSLVAQDTVRWVIAIIILGGILVATFEAVWLWLGVALVILAVLGHMLVTSLR
jgi:hypothetical protein